MGAADAPIASDRGLNIQYYINCMDYLFILYLTYMYLYEYMYKKKRIISRSFLQRASHYVEADRDVARSRLNSTIN